MVEFGMDLDDLREGRYGERTALQWLQAAAREAHRARQVRAASGSAQPGDEFEGLFPPWRPLGPDEEGSEEYPPAPLVFGPPDSRGNRQVSRGFATPNFPSYVPYAAAAPYPPPRNFEALSPAEEDITDEEADWLWPPATAEDAEFRAMEEAQFRAAAADRAQWADDDLDEADELAHRYLFGDRVFAPGDSEDDLP